MVGAHKVLGFPKFITTSSAVSQHPIALRIGTTDSICFDCVFFEREYDFDLPFVPRTIVDAGANVGLASLFFAHKYPNATIFAVEAERSNFKTLQRNVERNPQIIPIHAALWGKDGSVGVELPPKESGAFGEWAFVTREASGETVRALTISTLMKEQQLSSIDILKMDIEGAELEVFTSDCNWVSNVRSIMIETHDRLRGGCSAAVRNATSGFTHIRRRTTDLYVRCLNRADAITPCVV